MLRLSLKLNHFNDINDDQRERMEVVEKLDQRIVKITTNQLNVELDRKDPRYIKSLVNVKIVYKLKKGCLLLLGNLGCSYKDDYCGEFFCKRVVIEEGTEYENVKGVELLISFNTPTYRTTNDELKVCMGTIASDKNFVYNIKQFSEFMNIF